MLNVPNDIHYRLVSTIPGILHERLAYTHNNYYNIAHVNGVWGADCDLQDRGLVTSCIVSYQDMSVPSEAWVVNNFGAQIAICRIEGS